jgi:hypothetical protein
MEDPMFHIPTSRPTSEGFSNFLHAALAAPFGVLATLLIAFHIAKMFA